MTEVRGPWGPYVAWAVTLAEFTQQAAAAEEGAAVCLFHLDDQVDAAARGGYAALVIAYARAHEPVTVFDDGAAALLIKDGGIVAARSVSSRILEKVARLRLDGTLRIGITPLHKDPSEALERARSAAQTAEPGSVHVNEDAPSSTPERKE